MKRLAVATVLGALTMIAGAQQSHYVRPYVRGDGAYVPGHMQTDPDNSRQNNWSSQGNYNPYTGQAGSVNPYQQLPAPLFQPAPVYVQPVQPTYPFPGNGGRPQGRLF